MSSGRNWKKYLTTAELLEEAERCGDDGPDTIYITPPEDGFETEGDSGDEDCNDPNRLSSKQLQADAEFGRCAHEDSDNDRDIEQGTTDSEIEEPEDIVEPPKKKKSKHTVLPKRKWSKGDLQKGTTNPIRTSMLPILSLSDESEPLEFLELFLSADVVQLLVKYTVMYANIKNTRLELGNDEMYVFIAILYLSGYVPVPRRRMFWEGREDTHNVLVANSMRRNRFEEIFRFIHAADNNTLDANDKMSKLRPLVTKINSLYIRYAPMNTCLSIDESMIPYFGRHGCKQFIRGKPIRFGFKAWVLALSSGYCVSFDIYQGRKDTANDAQRVGLGASVVLNFADILRNNYPNSEFSLFFDNFFTSASLITELGEKGFGGTGTVRENRTDKCIIQSSNEMKKRERGAYDSAIDIKNNISCVKWKDNSIVSILSNEYGVTPLRKATRYSAKDKKKVEIPQPHVIHQYNTFMGGVDQMDNNISNYRIGLRGKKWYIPILFWVFDNCMNNAWILSKSYGKKMDSLEFRRNVVITLLKKYGQMPRATGPRPSFVPSGARKDGQHLIVTEQSRRRCASCKNKTTKACNRCGVALHDKCFLSYHGK